MTGETDDIVLSPLEPPRHARDVNEWIPSWAIFAVLAFTALLYLRGIYNGFTDMDDDTYIITNAFLKDFSWHGVKAIFTSFYVSNYHPFTTLTYLLEYRFFKLNPLPYHLVNIILHLANVWLVYVLCLKLSSKRFVGLFVATLFAIHPMHVESVAWVSERKDVLYAFFYLGALIFYSRYILAGFRKLDYALMLLFFVASLFSKSAAVTLPFLLIAIDVYKGRKINLKSLAEKIPLVLLSVIFGIINIKAQKAGGPIVFLFGDYGVINGFFLITSGIAAYFIFLVAPLRLSAMHYFPTITHGIMPFYYYLSLPLLIIVVWLAARRSNYRREIVFGISFFLISISVMVQIVSVGNAYMSERYSYVAYIGLFYAIAELISMVRIKNMQTFFGVMLIFFISYSALTWSRIGVWKNSEVLLTDVIDKNPGTMDLNYIYLLRGNYRMSHDNFQGALADYTQAIKMNPSFRFEYSAYFRRGNIYDILGDIKSAISDYSNSVNLSPGFGMAYNARGWDLFQSGDPNTALDDFNHAIYLNPEMVEAYNNRGWLYYRTGDPGIAVNDFTKAIQLAPGYDKPHFNRALMYLNAGNFEAAIEDYNVLLKYYPNNGNAFFMRGMSYINLNKRDKACQDLKMAEIQGNQKASEMIRQYCN